MRYIFMDIKNEYVDHMILKQRDKKHRQIMHAIYTFKRSEYEIKTL